MKRSPPQPGPSPAAVHPAPVSGEDPSPSPPFLHRLSSGLAGVALWSCAVTDLPPAALVHPEDLDLLAPDELDRHRRLRVPRDRDLFLATRVLVRSALSRYRAVAPRDWVFTRSPLGRPEVASHHRLRFSLSRSGTHAVCAIARTGVIGVDLECTRRHLPIAEIAPGILAPTELRTLRGAPISQQTALFLQLWTLKEAYAKALGLGLNLDVSRIAFTGLDSGKIRLTLQNQAPAATPFAAHLGDPADVPAVWRFRTEPLFASYVCAIAHRPHP